MFKIKVHSSAPEQLQHMEFWCKFLERTHWRKFDDYAEIVIESVNKFYYPSKLECVCKPFNDKYNIWGTKIRDFPVGGDGFWGDRVDVETIAKHGFLLVPDSIQSNSSWGGRDDMYVSGMNNHGSLDFSLRRVDTDYVLKGMSNGRRGEPVALFSHGIPVGRVVSIKGLIIGNEIGSTYSYYDARY